MLILTRRVGETIRIGDDVAVTLLGVQGMQGRVGISAPATVSVHREEIYERINGADAAHASVDPVDLFIKLNPSGLPEEHLTKGRESFVDGCTRAHYEVFLAGYQAAMGLRNDAA